MSLCKYKVTANRNTHVKYASVLSSSLNESVHFHVGLQVLIVFIIDKRVDVVDLA